MKKILIGIVVLTCLASCDRLDVKPKSQVSSDQAFADLNNAEAVVNGMYNNLQTVYMWRVQVITDVASDMSQQVDTWDALIGPDEFNFSIDNSEVDDLYTSLYRCIDIANNIIAYVPDMDIAQGSKDNLMGQAYFVRGLAYFDLARLFGGYPNVYGTAGVVITLTPSKGISEADFSSRSSLRATYDQVEADLQEALAKLPATSPAGKANKRAANALLARYYLYNQQWEQAEQFATAAIAGSALTTPFASIFTTKNTPESVFELQFNANDGQGLRQWYFPSSLGGRGGTALHDEMYQKITANAADERGKLTALNTTAGTYYTTKWSAPQNADNFQLLRLAEQFLIRAEARAEKSATDLSGALGDLNAVRVRAGLGPVSAASKEEMVQAILEERKLEFVGEGQRWFDVIRKGRAMTEFSGVRRTKGSVPSYSIGTPGKQVLPIPSAEMRTNTKLEQNEAYR